MAIGLDELIQRFGYHPATATTAEQHNEIRGRFLRFAEALDGLLPDGRDKATAFTKLQEAAHWSNSAIAMTAPVLLPE